MGVNTKAILTKGTTIEQLERALSEKYGEINVYNNRPDFFYLSFNDVTLTVSFANYCEDDYGIAGVAIWMGYYGNSVEIAKYLCKTFGGYIDENDCDDQGFYPIRHDLYANGKEFTKLDIFRHNVITQLGYDNLKKAMTLLDEYITLTAGK